MADSAITFTSAEVSTYYAARVPHLKQRRAAEWRGPCPIHNGEDDNFAVDPKTGRWYCHSTCGRGGDTLSLEEALNGVDFRTAKTEVFRLVRRTEFSNGKLGRTSTAQIVATYAYTDEQGELLYQVVRTEPKGFFQRRPSGNGGWVNRKCERQVLYHLPEVLEAPIVFVCEGERDVETLRDHGFVATTNAGGAKAPWLPQFTDALCGKEVSIIPDNDPPGWTRVTVIATALLRTAARIRVLPLPKDIKDISDWFAAGHSECEFIAMLEGVHDV